MGRPPSGTPLVGRATELAIVGGALEAARAGRGGVLLVQGQAGLGKTTLVVHATEESVPAGALLRGVCSQTTSSVPLWPWQRALHGRPDLLPRPRRDADGGRREAPAGAMGAAQLHRTAEAADRLLLTAVSGLLVVVLEDWHWSDEASRSLLQAVAVDCDRSHLLLLVTSRPDPAVTGLLRLPTVQHLPLTPLRDTDVARYLQVRTGRPPSPAELDRVVAASGGLPWLLEAAVAGGADELLPVGATATAGLDRTQLEVLTVAAVLGGPVDADLVAAVTGEDGSTVHSALEAARRTGVLLGDEFGHDLVRQAVAGLGRADPAVVCRTAAERLEDRPGDNGARLVDLWARAGDDPHCLGARARAALTLARRARRDLALDDARALLRSAADPRLVLSDPVLTAELTLEAAQVAFDLGEMHECLDRCEAAATAAARSGRGDLVAAAALVCRSVVFPRARETVTRLCTLALDLDPPGPVRSRLLSQLASAAAEAAMVERARELAAQSLALAEGSGEPAALLDAYRAQEAVLVEGPDAGAARMRLGEGSVREASRLAQPLAAAIGHGWRLTAALETCRTDVVDDALDCLSHLAAQGGPYVRWHERRAVAAVATLHGDLAAAREASATARSLALTAGDVVGVGMTAQLSLELARLRGVADELEPDIDQQLQIAPPIPIIQVARAGVAVVRGDLDEAWPYYESVMAVLGEALDDTTRGRGVAFQLTDLAVSLGDVAGADRLLRALDGYRAHPGGIGAHTTYYFGSPRRQLGRLAASAGRDEEAEPHLRAAVDVNVRLRARPQVCLARLDLGELLLRTGRPGEAGVLLGHAATEAARLDLPGPLSRADRLRHLATTGARGGVPDGLTPRETEIADLVRSGLSNRDIAEHLVVSERTVETHVSHLLRKLGHRNRRELLSGRPTG